MLPNVLLVREIIHNVSIEFVPILSLSVNLLILADVLGATVNITEL